MTPDLALLVLATVAAIVAVALVTGGASPSGSEPVADPVGIGRGEVRPTLAATVVGGVVVATSGWLLPAIVVAVCVWFAIRSRDRRSRQRDDIERIDALASWIENLRDVLIAGDQPIGAISATVATCPPSIRPHVRRLAAGLGRQDPDLVFRRFADDIDDPLGDLVAAGLLLAVQRGARTVAVLTSLATQARQQADRRRMVDAERAPIQREVGLITAIMGTLVVVLLVFGRAEYLRPYDTASGQLFLGGVLAIYAALLLRVQQLAVSPRPSRFLTTDLRRRPVDVVGDPQP